MKVYMRGGAQIVEPRDREIAEKIQCQQSLWRLPPSEAVETKDITSKVAQSYIQAVKAEVSGGAKNGQGRGLLDDKIAYTPLHGVVSLSWIWCVHFGHGHGLLDGGAL